MGGDEKFIPKAVPKPQGGVVYFRIRFELAMEVLPDDKTIKENLERARS